MLLGLQLFHNPPANVPPTGSSLPRPDDWTGVPPAGPLLPEFGNVPGLPVYAGAVNELVSGGACTRPTPAGVTGGLAPGIGLLLGWTPANPSSFL